MQSFLSKFVNHLLKTHKTFKDLTIVLPTKRSGVFFKRAFKSQIGHPTFLPQVLSIEDFILQVSKLQTIDNLNLLFEFYSVYTNPINEHKDSFNEFIPWAQTLLQDFNDIDQQLIDGEKIFDYVADAKRIEHWGQHQKTALTQNYINHYLSFKKLYIDLSKHLLSKQIGYNGLIAKNAVKHLPNYLISNPSQTFLFAGFNALTKVEEKIILEVLHANRGHIFWDTDIFHNQHPTATNFFIKKYKSNWAYYANHDFQWQFNQLDQPKHIYTRSVPKNISQCKEVAEILTQIHHKQGHLSNTAVILGNEALLPVMLNSLPKVVKHVNITMGLSIKDTPFSTFFENLFKLHLNAVQNNGRYYYKDLFGVIHNHLFQIPLLKQESFIKNLENQVYRDKSLFFEPSQIIDATKESYRLSQFIQPIFDSWPNQVNAIIKQLHRIILQLKINSNFNTIELEYLLKFENIFTQLDNLNSHYHHISNLSTLFYFYKQLTNSEKINFHGEPLQGLQIMGLLESRVLDFDHVILCSVNEGIIPTHHSSKSFIPFDIKTDVDYRMPTYQEKDAVFAYHFYRILQRSQNVYLLYNSVYDDFGAGEKSRFIQELEILYQKGAFKHLKFHQDGVTPKINSEASHQKSVSKSAELIETLHKLVVRGLSPSSINLFIKNPFQFYERKVLGVKEYKTVEENVAANTFGTIIHETLRYLYQPWINQILLKENILQMKSKVSEMIQHQFKNNYSLNSIQSGKNYLSYEIAQQYVHNFLDFEIQRLDLGEEIIVLALEEDFSIQHPINEINKTITIKGQIDRIEKCNGVLRIIDYKTGRVNSADLKIKDWNLLVTDPKYDKCLQVLLYAYMYTTVNNRNVDYLEAGIISFKNLKQGFMPFGTTIDKNLWPLFIEKLDAILIHLLDIDIPFVETEEPKYY